MLSTYFSRLAPLVLILAVSLSGASFTTLPGSGSLSGQPGETVGWGYEIQNDTNLWLVPMGLSSNGILFGSLTDIYDYGVVAPQSTTTTSYAYSAPGGYGFSLGLFEYLMPVNTPQGLIQSGTFTLQYQYYSDNPDINSSAEAIGQILSFSNAPFEVTTTSSVPEVGSGVLTMIALAIAGIRHAGRVRRAPTA